MKKLNYVQIYEEGKASIAMNNDDFHGCKNPIIWLNAKPSGSRSGVSMSPEEAIILAKLLYKLAYECGYAKA